MTITEKRCDLFSVGTEYYLFGGFIMRTKNNDKPYDSSILSANMETYVKQLKIAQQENPALATEEARKALRRTGVMADTSTKRKKRIVSWEF